LFFSSPRKKEERNPSHIAAHLQAPRANAATKALSKSAILPALLKETSKRYLYA